MANKNRKNKATAKSSSPRQVSKTKPGTDQQPLSFSQEELRELSFEISARWFSQKPATRFTLSVVHPWRIHAYWHISKAMMEKALKTATAPHALIIRVIDLTPTSQGGSYDTESFDVEVDGLENNWYIDLRQPGKHYIAELGLRSADSTLYPFARSNKIQVPRSEPSSVLGIKTAEYKRAAHLQNAQTEDKQPYSVAHLTDLLPSFNRFPEVKPQKKSRVPTASSLKTNTDTNAYTDRKIPHTSTNFSIGAKHPGNPPRVLNESPEEYWLSNTLPPHTNNNPLSEPLGSAPYTGFPQINTAQLAAYHETAKAYKGSFSYDLDQNFSKTEPLGKTISDTLETTATETPTDSIEKHHATQSMKRKAAIALEDILAESLFSGTGLNKKLNMSVQLELSGTSIDDQILTLFGNPIETDLTGRFSIRLKLDSGPGLAALVHAQRNNVEEGN